MIIPEKYWDHVHSESYASCYLSSKDESVIAPDLKEVIVGNLISKQIIMT